MTRITIAQALSQAASVLATSSESAHVDAEALLLHCLGKPRSFIYAWPERQLSDEQHKQLQQMVARRAEGVPVAHIVGEREFWSLPFIVNDSTLIPRPDTEILVETALNLPLAENAAVLDLGTGTGAIALALAHERRQWQMTAVDNVSGAVELAKANRHNLQLPQVEILQSDWFAELSGRKFQLIVSNPPYIEESDEHLALGDVRFEPRSALTSGQQGFAALFHIAEHAREYLCTGGYLLLEHGFTQGKRLREKLNELGYMQVATVRDFGSNERCTLGFWPG
ncbi:peptide chain release factor N(5)-glutamine methyltransferase [Shewanella sp. YIC-542]|uniref:peptide chain release factor N(5)-glutamine methyltransferase n=1 Tax=Shewanella mytili TaxID=3377111 RepID=UPI00398EC02D